MHVRVRACVHVFSSGHQRKHEFIHQVWILNGIPVNVDWKERGSESERVAERPPPLVAVA